MRISVLICLVLACNYVYASQSNVWQQIAPAQIASQGEQLVNTENYAAYYLNLNAFTHTLNNLGNNVKDAQVFTFPKPDGSYQKFLLWETPMMEPALEAKYPLIKTYTGFDPKNPFITIKADITYKGFHAKVFDGSNTYFLEPYSLENDGYYVCYYKKDVHLNAAKKTACEVPEDGMIKAAPIQLKSPEKSLFKTNGTVKKTYRLALACTYEYAVAAAGASPTKANVLSAMVTIMNRVNGVYERELSVSLILIGNNDDVIYITSNDPFNNNNGGTMLTQNQNNMDAVIGTANYDIGHVFSTGGGGIADLGCVCNNADKAEGVTGLPHPVGDPFAIDYVAHEMGHQFGANHTFNANTGSCSGNGNPFTAYEPGGGSTIMAYAGICGGSNNIQANSDDYFHAVSLREISDYITTGNGNNCPVTLPSSNNPPSIPSFTKSYAIPYRTPFELEAPTAVDADNDVMNYCWEQWNRGNFRSSWNNANLRGPIYRSFSPTISQIRTFPALNMLLTNNTNYIGEKLPEDDRYLTFKLTVRDLLNGWGSFNTSDDTVHIDVVNTGTSFEVTNPSSVVNWLGASQQNITWNVGGTTNSPINAATVDIYLSDDGGSTYSYVLAANTPNDGSEIITLPNITTFAARIKIKATNNIFFDINNDDFNIALDPNSIDNIPNTEDIRVYPVPSEDYVFISSGRTGKFTINIFNTLGQKVYNEAIHNQVLKSHINVSEWVSGIYYIHIVDNSSNESLVKKLVVK